MNGHYVLIGQTAVKEPDWLIWAEWFEHSDRRVAVTELPWCCVSTVFLGLDHGWRGEPMLFETMVFWAAGDSDEQDRCSTWLEAEAMHAAMWKQASRPKAIAAWLLRLLYSTIRDACDDWRESVLESSRAQSSTASHDS